MVHIYNIFTFTLMLKRCSLRFSCRCVVYERTYSIPYPLKHVKNTNYYSYDMHNNKTFIGFGYRIISTIIKALICLCYPPRTQSSVRVIHLGHKPWFLLPTSDTNLSLCYPPQTQTSVCVIRLGHIPLS